MKTIKILFADDDLKYSMLLNVFWRQKAMKLLTQKRKHCLTTISLNKARFGIA